MIAEEEIRKLLLHIVETGILRIRMYGWDGDAQACAVEADHLHNLPSLVSGLDVKLLGYYLDVSRISFLRDAKRPEAFASDWQRLASLLEAAKTMPKLDDF